MKKVKKKKVMFWCNICKMYVVDLFKHWKKIHKNKDTYTLEELSHEI